MKENTRTTSLSILISFLECFRKYSAFLITMKTNKTSRETLITLITTPTHRLMRNQR